MDLLYKVIILYLFFRTSSPEEYTGVLTRLWPLDSQTCSSEVFTTSYVYSECNNTFEDQPQYFPFNAMAFDGSLFIDVVVDVSTTKKKHYSYQGWFFFKNENPSSLFHYRDSKGITETIVWINDMKLKLYRKVKSNVKNFTGSQQLSKYKWYFITLGVGEIGYVSVRIDGVKDVYGMLTNRNSKELPAERGSYSIFLTRIDTTTMVPVLIKEETRCSISQCAYLCLRDIECFYISFDEEFATCKSCFMYSREETTGNYSTPIVYKVKT